jgi:hypothetical protein
MPSGSFHLPSTTGELSKTGEDVSAEAGTASICCLPSVSAMMNFKIAYLFMKFSVMLAIEF